MHTIVCVGVLLQFTDLLKLFIHFYFVYIFMCAGVYVCASCVGRGLKRSEKASETLELE